MAHDPAFLFYPDDFWGGVFHFSDKQIVQYLKLLTIQHSHGIVREIDFIAICKKIDPAIMAKFVATPDGFFNQRLRDEMEKRRLYAQLQTDRINKRWGKQPEKPVDKPVVPVHSLNNGNGNGNGRNDFRNTGTIPDEYRNDTVEIPRNKKSKSKTLKTNDEQKTVNEQPENVVDLPWKTENFIRAWNTWKIYKHEQFKFKYKPIGELAAVNGVFKLSGGDESRAIELIEYAMAHTWKGIYMDDKQKFNETNQSHRGGHASPTNPEPTDFNTTWRHK